MDRKANRVFLTAAIVLALGSAAWAQTTHVTYQGRLTDAGVPGNGTFDFVFTIFDAPAGGSALWTETIPGVTVTQGLFTVLLGQAVPLDATIFNGSPRWLEIHVQGTTLSPRQELSSAPGAIYATLAGTFSGSLAGEVTGTQSTTVVTNAVSINTPNAIVRRDASGNFAAATITANLSGNATTAGSATTATNFTGPLAGEVTGTQSATVVSNAVSSNTPNAIVRRDASGNFSAGSIALAGILFPDGTTQATAPSIVYTRWGRTTCPAGTALVYAGFAGGSHYTASGGGKNMLCLSGTPSWLAFNDGDQNGNLMYGTEYETAAFGPLVALHDFEAPCAVCLRTSASVVLMVPGAAVCPASWTLEYAGYLMSTNYQQMGGETVCVDQSPEATGSPASANGHLWYPTEAECGSLPCPPYVQNREFACSVCSR